MDELPFDLWLGRVNVGTAILGGVVLAVGVAWAVHCYSMAEKARARAWDREAAGGAGSEGSPARGDAGVQQLPVADGAKAH